MMTIEEKLTADVLNNHSNNFISIFESWIFSIIHKQSLKSRYVITLSLDCSTDCILCIQAYDPNLS